MARPMLMNVDIQLNEFHGFCTGCCSTISSDQIEYAHHHTHISGKSTRFYLRPVCRICSLVDYALQEAKTEQRRFTHIGCHPGFTNDDDETWTFNGRRCFCGAVTHLRLKFCVQCSRKSRMLDKANAQNKMLFSALKELRAVIREEKRELAETT